MSNTDSPQKNGGLEMPEGGKYEDYLAVLQEHRLNCERENNFVEADLAKQRIEELKLQEGQRQMENLLLKQQQDRLQIEEAQQKEYEQFQQQWEQRIGEKEQEHEAMTQQLQDRHQKELEENRQVLENKIPQIFKASSELLNNKKIQD